MSKGKLNIRGIAVRAGVSRNGIRYTEKELEKFAPTLISRPILKDHESRTDNTIGKVEDTSYLEGAVPYVGWIKEDGTGLLEKIQDRRISEVSIGAIVGRLVKEDEDSDVLIAKDMHGLELSTTPTPGVIGTSISESLKDIKEKETDTKKKVRPVLEDMRLFVEEKCGKKKDILTFEKSEEDIIKVVNKILDEKSKNNVKHKVSEVKEETNNVKENISEEKQMADEKIKKVVELVEEVEEQPVTKEQPVEEVPKEEPKVEVKEEPVVEEPKEEVKKEEVDTLSNQLKETDSQIKKIKEELEQFRLKEKQSELEALQNELDKTKVSEEKKDETIGKVKSVTEEKTDDVSKQLEGYVFKTSEDSLGYEFFQENLDTSGYKRLSR